MLTKADKIFFAAVILLLIALPIFWKDVRNVFTGSKQTKLAAVHKEKQAAGNGEKSGDGDEDHASGGVRISKRWDLPSELKEVSDIVYLDPKRFACVQDEEGSLFIFNTGSNKIERKIPFTGRGDFEGLALVESTAYVLRSDGVIFEVKDYRNNHPQVKQYSTHLTAKNDCEGLVWDKKQNRLLVTVKKSGEKTKSPIYSFDLASKKMAEEPVLTINFDHPVFKNIGKKKQRGIRPSAIGIHPSTGELYVLEGTNPKLLVMNKDATPKKLMVLDKDEFVQPEGLTFSSTGDLFISNEGVTSSGNILQVATE